MRSKHDTVSRLGRSIELFPSLVSLLKALGRGLLPILAALGAAAQQPRISGQISNKSRTTIVGSHPPATRSMQDSGRVSSSPPVQGMSIVLSRTAAQESDLQALIAAQQNPSSTQYHLWLTPAQFAS